jgi:hypothetical protein
MGFARPTSFRFVFLQFKNTNHFRERLLMPRMRGRRPRECRRDRIRRLRDVEPVFIEFVFPLETLAQNSSLF